ncbi:restriction endonuclease [Psychrobacter sp. PAMC 21119]|uniref:restriction endonuclease n=1 Tax=Psychrobacter sp. PAMC 21119 TaxID=1112209 RepID=UPI000288C566|nr:restriction endonuclease [Psychrobacter sp. PAMC 21119]
MKISSDMPPFGDILNAGIQSVKQLCNRTNGITSKAFDKTVREIAGITDDHLKVSFVDPEFPIHEDEDMIDSCYDYLTGVMLTCLVAIGAIKSEIFNIEANLGRSSVHLIPFNSRITPENLTKIDPFGKIYFWLAGDNFVNHRHSDVSSNTYESKLDRFDSRSFRVLREVNKSAYGEKGDPLINHLISETMRRTSVFMNNYANVIAANDYVKVTPKMILDEIFHLTPLQFEHLCLNVVETSLKREDPNATFSSRHTGQSNDGGIDGIIKQDCGAGEIHTYYIQAKQYSEGNTISNKELRNFVGGFTPDIKYHHGIFITTSEFTKPAQDYAKKLESHSLTLINKMALLDLMLEHEIGLEKVQTETLVMNKSFFRELRKN